MAHASDPDLLVLHALRLKHLADVEAVSVFSGLPAAEVGDLLQAMPTLVAHRDGRLSGWSLTAAGREVHRQRLTAELAGCGRAPDVDQSYRAFLNLNEPFKVLCTDWQVRDLGANVLNDHTDPAYDAAVVARLDEIHAAVLPICARLTAVLGRFGAYAARFTAAVDRLDGGDREAFTKPLSGSYHDIWMELHEDLLTTLEIERREGVA